MRISSSISLALPAVICLSLVLVGCGVDPPYSPRTYYESVEDVIIHDVQANSVKLSNKPLLSENSKIAVMGFQSPEDSQGGVLVSDIFSLLLQKDGYGVIERDNIDHILREQRLVGSGKTTLSDLEVARRLGKLVAADYMIFGAVTLYKSEGQTIYLPIRIREEDREEYLAEYNAFREWYVGRFWSPLVPKDVRIKQVRTDLGVLSLDELDEELKKIAKTEFRVIASIGISAKMVSVRDAKIQWMGQAETADFTLVGGASRILREFIESIQRVESSDSEQE